MSTTVKQTLYSFLVPHSYYNIHIQWHNIKYVIKSDTHTTANCRSSKCMGII